MVSLRRDGFTMKAIAEKVGVSERTVRRYVPGVEPDIRMPSELDSNELTDGFYDQVLASRRRIVSIRKLGADESLRAEFFRDFMAHVLRDWIDVLRTEHLFRELGWPPGVHEERPDDGDVGPGA